MRKTIKKILVVILTVLLLFCTGCAEKEPEPLRICIDLEYVNGAQEQEEKDWLIAASLKTRLIEYSARAGLALLRDIEVEFLPMTGAEREAALQRIRTEMMSGRGPDLFIVACNEVDPVFAPEALFTIPEKAMELGLFMVLDEYMENNTYFAEWDKMNQTVLAAGKNEEGQQIIPMCYRIPAAIYNAKDVEHTASKDMTWMDMVESEDIALRAAAAWPWEMPMTTFILGKTADYREEELLFTEEELVQRFAEITALTEQQDRGDFNKVPAHYTEFLGHEFDIINPVFDRMKEEYTMIPLYSDDGGVTAEITTYMAINRNTERPEDAFRVLDFMMSYSEQRSGQFYQRMIYTGEARNSGRWSEAVNMPMYDVLMSEKERIYWPIPNGDNSMNGWYLSDAKFAELCEVREQITHVKFRNELDKQFVQAYRDYYEVARHGEDGTEVVSESYRNIQRMLRE